MKIYCLLFGFALAISTAATAQTTITTKPLPHPLLAAANDSKASTTLQAMGNYARVVVSGITPERQRAMLEAGVALDEVVYDKKNQTITGEFSADEVRSILAVQGLSVRALVYDLERYYSERNKTTTGDANKASGITSLPTGFNLGSMGGMLTYTEMMLEMDSLHMAYPTLVSQKYSIGTSLEGRTIWAFKVSDNVTVDEAEPEVLLTSLIHAREGLAGMQLFYFLDHLLQKYAANDPEARFLINEREIFVVPILNPDGYVFNQTQNPTGGGLWRKNRRDNGDGTFGVDLNRNFGIGWGYDNTGSSPITSVDTYRGAAAFSEPETQVIRNFTNSRHFKTALNHHTYSNVLIRPFGYDETIICPDETAFTVYGNILTQNSSYNYGKVSQVLGYNVNGSTDDWMYGETTAKTAIISMTPETGTSADGFWPALNRIVPLCAGVEDTNTKMVWLAGEYFDVVDKSHTVYSVNARLPFGLQNLGQSTSLPVVAKFISTNPYVLATPSKSLNTVGSFVTKTDSVSITLAATTPNNTTINGILRFTFGGYSLDTPTSFLYRKTVGTNSTTSTPDAFLRIYPNPTDASVTLETNLPYTEVCIFDILGRMVYCSHATDHQLALATLTTGTYFVHLYNDDGQRLGIAKLVKR